MEVPVKPERQFLPQEFEVEDWEKLEPYFEDLVNTDFGSYQDLWNWMRSKSELEAVLEENGAWRYIKMNIDTRDKEASDSFHYFIENIEPKIAPYQNKFDLKFLDASFPEISDDQALNIVHKKAKNQASIFREENIPLQTKLQAKSQEFGMISSEMTIDWEGKKLTLPQASVLLKETDRAKREEAYRKIQTRRLADKEKLDNLFTELISLRHEVAQNAGFDNYRDYKFVEMCRFDYTEKDCRNFHEAIAREVVPLMTSFDQERKNKLGLDSLRPWDGQVDISGKPALKPFEGAEDLVNKSIACFNEVDPYFGQCLEVMNKMSYLDLESKEGKAPGGFNYPLYEIGVPFIYMNSANTVRDMVTMMHEGGHAVHSFLSRNLAITAFKDLTSEVAELASMSMELMSMEHWHHFFQDEDELKRAKKEQLEQVIGTLPWVAQIDKFQHWIYENPTHSAEERTVAWNALMDEFFSSEVDWSGLESERGNLWQKQLHLFEVPFYYIEYGMAQLGAIAIWKNYKENPSKTVEQYKAALSLGYTKSIGEIYSTAGIKFDFSQEYVKELAAFVRTELEAL
jgi:oligoendopeptidase F